MKNKLLIMLGLPLWLAVTNCGMEAVHAEIHSKTKIQAAYAISCDGEEFKAITTEWKEFLKWLEGLDPGSTTVKSTLHLNTDGTCEVKENGKTVSKGTWKAVNDTEIEVTIEGKKILLEMEKWGEEIILWGEDLEELCVDSKGEVRIDNDTDARIDATGCGC